MNELCEGIAATPAALEASRAGKEWDATAGNWVLYDLDNEVAAVLSVDAEDRFSEELRSKKLGREKHAYTTEAEATSETECAPAEVVETELYDLLGCAPCASEASVRARGRHVGRRGGAGGRGGGERG